MVTDLPNTLSLSPSPTTTLFLSPTHTPPTTLAVFCVMGVSSVSTVLLLKTCCWKEKQQQLFHQEEQRQQTLLKEEPKQPTSAAWWRVKQKQQDWLQDQQQLQQLEQLLAGPDCTGEIFLVQMKINHIARVNTWMAADKAAGHALSCQSGRPLDLLDVMVMEQGRK